MRELNDFRGGRAPGLLSATTSRIHVRFGHRWLPEMMALFGEKRPVEEFVKATQQKFKRLANVYGGKVPH